MDTLRLSAELPDDFSFPRACLPFARTVQCFRSLALLNSLPRMKKDPALQNRPGHVTNPIQHRTERQQR